MKSCCIYRKLFGKSASPRQLPPAGVNKNSALADPQVIPALLEKGKAIFPESDYGYRAMIKNPRSEFVYTHFTNPYMQGEHLILKYIEPRKIYPDGRYVPGFDCFDSSFWLYKNLQSFGFKPEMAVLRNSLWGIDYAVSNQGQLLSLTPGFDQTTDHRTVDILSPSKIAEGWQDKAIGAIPMDSAANILKLETLGDLTLAHGVKIFFSQNKKNIEFLSYLVKYARPIGAAKTVFAMDSKQHQAAIDLALQGQTLKAAQQICLSHFLTGTHPLLPLSSGEETTFAEHADALILEILPHIILKLNPLL